MITKHTIQDAAVKAYCAHVRSGVIKHSAEIQLAYMLGFGNGGAFSASTINTNVKHINKSITETSGLLARIKRAMS
jgi:pyrimidine operon attenuation protein/uracil phosphoribosyltransferase